MVEFAEKIGWRIQKHDDMALNQLVSKETCLRLGCIITRMPTAVEMVLPRCLPRPLLLLHLLESSNN